MYIILPFPRCKKCGKIAQQGYHYACGGMLEIDPETKIVYCPKCNKKWNLNESRFICSCQAEFDAEDIPEAVEEMLLLCRECMRELDRKQRAEQKRIEMCQASIRQFVNSFLEGLGYCFGVAVETVVCAIFQLLFRK